MGFRSFHFKLAVSVVAKQRQVASTQTGGRFNTIMKGITKAHKAVVSNAMQNLPVLSAISFVKVLASTTSTTIEVG